MRSGNNYAPESRKLTYGKRKLGCWAQGIKYIRLNTVSGKYSRSLKAKAYAKASIIVRDNNTSFASVITEALNIIGKALSCFSYYILIDTVSTNADNTSKSTRSKFEIV